MKQILLALCIFSAFITSANAGDLYSCTDSHGNKIVTSTPQDGMENCVLKDSYDEPTPEQKARNREMQQQRIYEQTREQGYNNQMKQRVELEKKYLESKKSGSSADFVDAVNERIKELESNPEQYFYNKEQREKAAANRPSPIDTGVRTIIDPKTGRVIEGIPVQ